MDIIYYNIQVKRFSASRALTLSATMRSFGKIPTRISDPRSLGPWSIEGTDESFPRVDLSVTLMCCAPSDLGSLVLTRIIPMERTFSSSSTGKSWRKLHTKIKKASSETRGQIVGTRESVNGRKKNRSKKSARSQFPYPPLAICPWTSDDDNMKIFW